MRARALLLPVLFTFLVGAAPASAWTWPVEGPVLTQFHMVGDPYAGGQHRGIDVAADAGTPVLAPAAGTVTFAGVVPRGGRTVTILTGDGYSVTLLHLGSVGVVRGAEVAEGSPVGNVGATGDAEHAEPYVHLGIRVAASEHGYVDPLGFLPTRGPVPLDPVEAPVAGVAEDVRHPPPAVPPSEDAETQSGDRSPETLPDGAAPVLSPPVEAPPVAHEPSVPPPPPEAPAGSPAGGGAEATIGAAAIASEGMNGQIVTAPVAPAAGWPPGTTAVEHDADVLAPATDIAVSAAAGRVVGDDGPERARLRQATNAVGGIAARDRLASSPPASWGPATGNDARTDPGARLAAGQPNAAPESESPDSFLRIAMAILAAAAAVAVGVLTLRGRAPRDRSCARVRPAGPSDPSASAPSGSLDRLSAGPSPGGSVAGPRRRSLAPGPCRKPARGGKRYPSAVGRFAIRAAVDPEPMIGANDVLRHHTDLLRQLDPSYRPRVHDDRRRRRGAASPAAGRGDVLPDGNR